MRQKAKKTAIFLLTWILGTAVGQAMGKRPDTQATSPAASNIPAYNNPYDPQHTDNSVMHRQENSNAAPAPVPSPSPNSPSGLPDPQGTSGVVPTPDSPGTRSAPSTSGGAGVGAIGE